MTTEANSATDNPMVFAGEREIVSGGNFHGAPFTMAADLAAIALAQLATISERRTEVPSLDDDRPPAPDIDTITRLIASGVLEESCRVAVKWEFLFFELTSRAGLLTF